MRSFFTRELVESSNSLPAVFMVNLGYFALVLVLFLPALQPSLQVEILSHQEAFMVV